jgi:DNA-binding LacI/PurR family transcriptional regulator
MSITRIAEAANVSYATAWRILNKRPVSSEGAIEAVHRAVRQIGYEPAPAGPRRGRPAKVIDGIRTRNVALLHLRPGTTLSTSVLDAVQRMLAERDLNLLFAHVEESAALPQAVRAGNVDGILGYGKFPDGAITPQIERIPAVWMMSRNDRGLDRFGDRVGPDHAAIGQLAAEHLLAGGARRLAVLNPLPGNEIYRLRCEAFALAGEDRGVHVDRYAADPGDAADPDAAMTALAERWWAVPVASRAKGLFVPADALAVPLYRFLGKHHVRCGRGEAAEVVSSDNDAEVLRQLGPAPVTMDLNREAIAQQAVERLLWRMRHGTAVPQTALSVRPTLVAPR